MAAEHQEERKFGLSVGGLFVVLGALLLFWRHRTAPGAGLAAAGLLLVVLALAAPALLVPLRRGWMRFARVLARFNTAAFIFLTFYFLLTPLAFLLRFFGRDELRRRRAPSDTMWSPYPERNRDPKHFEKIF